MCDDSSATEGDGDPGFTYRGVVLPKGMTPGCLDAVARILNRHASGESDDLDADAAVKVFEAVRSFQPQKVRGSEPGFRGLNV